MKEALAILYVPVIVGHFAFSVESSPMNRFILAIAIIIPLATVFFVVGIGTSKQPQEEPVADQQSTQQVAEPTKEVKESPVIEITAENFQELVADADKPVVLDFWAPWCGPCMILGPHVEQIAAEYDGLIVVGKVNTDQEQEIAFKFEADSIPLVVILKNGDVVGKTEGFDPKTPDQIRKIIDEAIEP